MKMTVKNQFKMQLLAKSANESFARVAVSAFISQLDPTLDELADIKTAVSEAVTNCIVHAYKEKIGYIYITVRILKDNRISVSIKDKGCGIEDIEKAMEPMFTTGGAERAGLGFAVMQSFTDKLRVASKVGKGTTVTFYKQLSER
jgi:stage II sporulation protein AB (anti-sigma F factor)